MNVECASDSWRPCEAGVSHIDIGHGHSELGKGASHIGRRAPHLNYLLRSYSYSREGVVRSGTGNDFGNEDSIMLRDEDLCRLVVSERLHHLLKERLIKY